ncbi:MULTISPECIES: DUF2501 domain-containing protein [unclassified Variovorax]|uniref:DUF2501 domain-containing protein n=1 Tax=unclassified Variovorax TaxID=663243 RepID=UPI00076CB2F8|nr:MULTISPECIES: DUF2501 domain-containing protein [unclassified Variovorax]KWT83843.1 putative glycoprotein/receptor [Variovorax sp. WDL1]PNG46522.1 hypothetical protein CHC06_06864 [Variovorax sp. B2]PNG47656.1 hypothetical protein CHC07_06823 [Variovorax sp. B4]VTV14282.1 hypothetical protein WDL1CHR_04837 [Variovorax sp. WDL1]
MHFPSIVATAALLALAQAGFAQNQMLDALKDNLGGAKAGTESGTAGNAGTTGAAGAALAKSLGISMPAIGASSMGNAAGVLQYCIKNNYLSNNAAGGVKDKLLGMVTGNKAQQTGFANGSKGLLQGSDGASLNLKSLGAKLKTQACDYVLTNAKSLV